MKANKTILSISLVALLVISTLGISYSYFSANLRGELESASTITMEAGKMILTYQDNSNNIDIRPESKIYPRGTADSKDPTTDAWIKKSFAITGTNTTELDMKYKISMVVDANTFQDNALSYELIGHKDASDTSSVVLNNSTGNLPTGISTITFEGSPYFKNADGISHTYQLLIYFLETGEEQNSNQGSKFAAHIEVKGQK